MLKQIIFENWKTYRSAVLPIDPLTVLIGTNASGKSNAIDALEFLNRTTLGKKIANALTGIRGGIEWATWRPQTQFTLKALVQGEDETIDYLYSITVETKPRVHLLAESLVRIKKDSLTSNSIAQVHLFKTNEPLGDTIRVEFYQDNKPDFELLFHYFHSFLAMAAAIDTNMAAAIDTKKEVIEGSKIVLETIQNIFILNPIPSLMRDFSLLSDSFKSDASNIAGVLAALPDERKAEVEATLSTYVKHLPERDIQRVWAEPVGRLKTDAMLYCEELWKPGQTTEIDARGMSDGTLRFLAILTALLTRPEGSQLVIEEVDNGLHPSRAELLLRMLREIGEKRKIDVLVTTHNPALLDALGPEMVPFVVVAHRDTETGESKLTLLEDIENLPKLMASGPLGKLATKGAIERSLSDTN
jgi:predicted ATPase